MCNVDITVVLLNKHILADLVTNIMMGQLSVSATLEYILIRPRTDR